MSLSPYPMPDPFSSPTHIGRKSEKATKRKPMTPSDSTHLETELQALRKHLRPIPFVPRKTLDFAHHETLLRNLGLWDFLHLEFDRHIRTDLLEQLIATYDPKRHHSRRSRVNGVPIRLSRAHLARALKLEVKRCRKNSNEAVDSESKVVSDDEVLFLEALVSNWVVLLDDSCASPAEVSKFLSFIKEKKLHMVDWAGLVWFMVERELSKGPELIHCHYASHLQLLLKFQRPRLFEGGFVDVVVNPGGVKMEGSDDFEGQESKNLQTSDELGHGEYGMEPKVEEVVNDFKIGGSDSCCGMESVQGKSDAEPKQEEVLIDARFGGCVDFCQMELEDNRVELNLVQVMNEKKPQTEDSVEEKVDVVDENLGGSEDFHNVSFLKLEQGKIENESVEEVTEDDIMDLEECKEKQGENNRTELSLVLDKDEKELNMEDSVEENEDVVDENLGSSKDLDRAGLESSRTCLNLEQGKIENEIMEEVKEDDVTDLEDSKEKERENTQMEVILVQEKNEMELNMEDSIEEKEDGVDENLGGSKDLHMAELETSGTYLILEQGKIENENVEEVKEDNVIDLEEFKEKEGESNEMELSLVWGKNEKEPNMEDITEEKEDMVDENLGGPKDFHRAELENNKTYLNLEQRKIENENVEEGKEDGVIDLEECKEKGGENGQMEVGLVQEKNEMDLNREDSEEEKEDMVDENLGGSEDFYMVELENKGTCLNLEQGKIKNESVEEVKEDDVIDLEECQEKGQIWLNQKKDIRGLFLQQCSLNQFGELKLHSGRKEVSEEQSDDLFMEQPPSDTLSLPDLVQSTGTKDPYNALPVPTHIINDSYQESTSRTNTLVRMDGSSMYGNPLKRKNDYENYFCMETWESKLDTNMNLGGPSVFDNSLKTERTCHNVQAHSLNASQKRMKIDGPWEEKSMDFSFCMEQIASWMAKAKSTFAEREQACISAEMNRQMLVNEIKHRDNIIQLCEKTKHEELQKREGVICRLEHDVCFMENLLGDYRRALKETRKTFSKYRQRYACPHPEMPLYRDVAGSGGVVLSVTEFGKQPLESDRFYEIKPSMIEEKISEFQLKWVGKLEAHLVKVFLLNERLQVVEEEAKLLKETCLKALNF